MMVCHCQDGVIKHTAGSTLMVLSVFDHSLWGSPCFVNRELNPVERPIVGTWNLQPIANEDWVLATMWAWKLIFQHSLGPPTSEHQPTLWLQPNERFWAKITQLSYSLFPVPQKLGEIIKLSSAKLWSKIPDVLFMHISWVCLLSSCGLLKWPKVAADLWLNFCIRC